LTYFIIGLCIGFTAGGLLACMFNSAVTVDQNRACIEQAAELAELRRLVRSGTASGDRLQDAVYRGLPRPVSREEKDRILAADWSNEGGYYDG
jgi:hypothetical protein